jgi:hypothetical protein
MKQLGMDEIERADVEARRHADLASERGHALDEIEARAAEIETAVDMRLLDGDEGARIDRLGEADQEPHGESRRPAVDAVGEFAVEVGQFEGHRGQATGATFGGSMRRRRGRRIVAMSPQLRPTFPSSSGRTRRGRCHEQP